MLQIGAQRSGSDLEKEEEHHRSMWRRLRCHMTLWCSSDVAEGAGFVCILIPLAGDAESKSMYSPVFALAHAGHLCGLRT